MKKQPKLSLSNLLIIAKKNFDKISVQDEKSNVIPFSNFLMSGLAIFGLKYPSLLQFDKAKNEPEVKHNLKTLYHINQVPSDTYLRVKLDELDPKLLRPTFCHIFSTIQRSNQLKQFKYLNDSYFLSIDGTGFFSSHKVHCDQCCEKHHRDGSITYYHQMLGGSFVNPDIKAVIPIAPEPILKQDGKTKNDCERNASKRLLSDLRLEHPHLKIIILEDSLASNAPHIKHLQDLNLSYILGAKQSDHKFLFDYVKNNKPTNYEMIDDKGIIHRFKYLNNAPLNASNKDLKINFLEYWEIHPNKKIQHFSWVTDITITKKNIYKIMKGGRVRWKIENETFNTLKNQGYHFEHNFGHGKKHLSTIFAYLMMLAFLIDQVQILSNVLFQKAIKVAESNLRFWEKIRGYFFNYLVNSWDDILNTIVYGKEPIELIFDTS